MIYQFKNSSDTHGPSQQFRQYILILAIPGFKAAILFAIEF